MTKRENLFAALFPIGCILFMVISQKSILYMLRLNLISENFILPSLRVAQLVLLFFCGCIAVTRTQPSRIRPKKKLLVLFGIFAVLQLLTILIIPFSGGKYRDIEFASYAYLAVLLGGALTFGSNRVIRVHHIALLSVGYIINLSCAILLSTVYRLKPTPGVPLKPPFDVFIFLYMASFILAGLAFGMLHDPISRSYGSIPIVVIASAFILAACLYMLRWASTLLLDVSLIEHRIIGPILKWLTGPEKLYYGYLQMILFFAGWHGALLPSLWKKDEAMIQI